MLDIDFFHTLINFSNLIPQTYDARFYIAWHFFLFLIRRYSFKVNVLLREVKGRERNSKWHYSMSVFRVLKSVLIAPNHGKRLKYSNKI